MRSQSFRRQGSGGLRCARTDSLLPTGSYAVSSGCEEALHKELLLFAIGFLENGIELQGPPKNQEGR